ncbi:hypothetical protein [Streptomyces sp. H27-C3]|uniref:hypothetical protein n=1 Tax=unclassified Streptomyces TaxID=2593676 RepID=UPI0024B90213|nr:hypothetical protein [Streptomyces sp. H27-C3]MDJ0466925.1 hypothetical protein [Streptomyces sp. H27-C3]
MEPLMRLRGVMPWTARVFQNAGGALAGAFGNPADGLAVRVGIQDGGGQLSAGSVQRLLYRLVFPPGCFQRVLAHTPILPASSLVTRTTAGPDGAPFI